MIRWRDFAQIWDYAQAVWEHKQAALFPGLIVAVAEATYAAWGSALHIPAWAHPTLWVLAFLPAQFLAWRDAVKSKGTPESPFVSPGLRLGKQRDVAGGSWPNLPENMFEISIEETTEGALNGTILIRYDVPVIFHNGTIVLHDVDGKGRVRQRLKETRPYAIPSRNPLDVERIDGSSFRVNVDQAAEGTRVHHLELWVRSPHIPSVVRIEKLPIS